MKESGISKSPALWVPLALLVLLQVLLLGRDQGAVLRGELAGPDDYLRLVRVMELHETGAWYSDVIGRANAPHGEAMHWTRPLDVLLLAGAAPLAPVLGIRGALHWWGVFVTPALHVAALLALLWAARPLIDREALVYVGVLSLAQPGILFHFLPGRADHHGLLYLLFVVLVGFGLRALVDRDRGAGAAALAGLVGALALWVSLESLIPVALMLAALGFTWVARGGEFTARGWAFSAALAAALALALALERAPSELATPIYDKLSVVHVLIFVLVAAFWAIVSALQRNTGGPAGAVGRGGLALLGGGAVAAAVWVLFPKFFGGPLVGVDVAAAGYWVNLMADGKPLWRGDDPMGSARRLMIFLGPVAVAAPAAATLAWRGRGGARRGWAFAAFAIPSLALLAAFGPEGERWATYAEYLMVLPLAAVVAALVSALDGEGRGAFGGAWRALARIAVVLAFAVGFALAGGAIPRPGPALATGERECTVGAIAPVLTALPGLGEGRERILTLPYFGAELLYRTPHEVVSTGFHGDSQGLADVHAFFSAKGQADARAVLARRGATLVLTCPVSNEAVLYVRADGGESFYDRLKRDEVPPWLRAVRLPDEIAGHFRLYRAAASDE